MSTISHLLQQQVTAAQARNYLYLGTNASNNSSHNAGLGYHAQMLAGI